MCKRLFTSESVTEGHPDKIADQISDAILDSLLSQDPKSRVAVETLITTGQVHVAGEVTTNGYADVNSIVRDTVLGIGYDSSDKGFDGNSCGVSISIGQQSPDIAQGVDDAYEERVQSSADPLDLQGAGDQGLMFGYACNDTKELMPLPIWLAHELAQQLSKVRKSGELGYLRPDGKTQVTIEYDGDKAVALDTVVISSQHHADIDVAKKLTPEVIEHVINPVLAKIDLPKSNLRTLINPTGRFVVSCAPLHATILRFSIACFLWGTPQNDKGNHTVSGLANLKSGPPRNAAGNARSNALHFRVYMLWTFRTSELNWSNCQPQRAVIYPPSHRDPAVSLRCHQPQNSHRNQLAPAEKDWERAAPQILGLVLALALK